MTAKEVKFAEWASINGWIFNESQNIWNNVYGYGGATSMQLYKLFENPSIMAEFLKKSLIITAREKTNESKRSSRKKVSRANL